MKISGMPAVFLAMSSCLFSCRGGDSQTADRLVSINSHRLEIRQEGKGSPTIVIDAGLGDSLDKLRPLQDRLALVTRVITYNRAGYGLSEPGPLPRTGVRAAEELKTLLKKASVAGPYVLVGHSLGALNLMMFAVTYPKDVAGVVLLDPPPLSFILGKDYKDLGAMAERMTAEWEAMADSAAKSPDPRDQARAGFFRMIASEHREMMSESGRQVDGIATFGDMLLVVMAAGRPNRAFGPIAEEYQKYWIEQSRALIAKSTKGEFVLAEESSHYLYLDVPELVERSILSMVSDIRAK